jgi:hypothetical protein
VKRLEEVTGSGCGAGEYITLLPGGGVKAEGAGKLGATKHLLPLIAGGVGKPGEAVLLLTPAIGEKDIFLVGVQGDTIGAGDITEGVLLKLPLSSLTWIPESGLIARWL